MKNFILLFSVFLLTLTACQLTPFDNVSWNTEVQAPIAFTEVGIWDVLTDSTYIGEGNDRLLSLIYRDTVFSLSIKDLVEIPDTVNSYSLSLDTLRLDTDTISQRVTLGEFARQLAASSDPTTAQTGAIILANQGNTVPVIPDFAGQSTDVIAIDASEFFESAQLDSGELELTIDNQFPLDISNVIFRISNANLGTDIVRDTFPLIASRSSQTESYDLAGQEIESNLEGQLENLDISGGFFVPIDTNDFIELRLIARNLKANSATAIFPGQTIIDTLAERTYELPGEFEEISLTKLVVRSGQIRAEARSTVEDSISFLYELPKAIDDQGNSPRVLVKLPPAPPNGFASKTETFQLGGFEIDLRGENGNTFNTLVERTVVSLLFSGKLVTLNKTDSVQVDFALENLEPVYVEGYIGQTEIKFEGREAIDVFENLDVDRIKFSEAKADIVFNNSIGLPAEVLVEEFSANNQQNGSQVRLASSDLVAGPFRLQSPSLPDTNAVISSVLALSPANSNINSFISSLADEVSYSLTLKTNPGGERSFDNFISENSALDVLMDFQLPLKGVVDRLVFADTADFSSQALELGEIESGGLALILENEFPLEVEASAEVYDENWQLLEVLVDKEIVAAAPVDGQGRTLTPEASRIARSFEIEELNQVLEEGKHIIFNFVLNTRPGDQEVGIYSDYRVRAKLVGDFTYKLSN